MSIKRLLIVSGFIISFATASYADSIKIPIPPLPPPPPVPDFSHDTPEPADVEVEFVVPPPPPFISVEVSHPDYWFYDDDEEEWFCYEKGHKRNYEGRHEYRDDGKHFYAKGKKWRKVEKKHALDKGWVKKHKAKEKGKSKKKWWKFWGDD